jgi:PPOX class probable FMN-dependent enzyme
MAEYHEGYNMGGKCSPTKPNVTPWISLIDNSSSKSRGIRGSNYVQLATVDEQGKPNCRTVVFRGFLHSEDTTYNRAVKMITDSRSAKVGQINAAPFGELVWWFPHSSEQFRISGILYLVTHSEENPELREARQNQWKSMRDTAREQFYWDPPSLEFTGPPTPPPGGRDEAGNVLPPPETFLLMLLLPDKVKYLRLMDNYAQLDIRSAESGGGGWKSMRVNP